MRAGELRQVITIQAKTLTTDEYGGPVETWADFAAGVRAKAQPLSGRELIAAQAAQSETEMKFITRHISGVTQSMRVVMGSNYYNITAVIDVDALGREMHLMTATGLSEG